MEDKIIIKRIKELFELQSFNIDKKKGYANQKYLFSSIPKIEKIFTNSIGEFGRKTIVNWKINNNLIIFKLLNEHDNVPDISNVYYLITTLYFFGIIKNKKRPKILRNIKKEIKIELNDISEYSNFRDYLKSLKSKQFILSNFYKDRDFMQRNSYYMINSIQKKPKKEKNKLFELYKLIF